MSGGEPSPKYLGEKLDSYDAAAPNRSRSRLRGERRRLRYYKWLGPLQSEEKHTRHSSAPIPRLALQRDPYPLVLLEAMAHGKPVLTTTSSAGVRHRSTRCLSPILSPEDLDGIVDAAARLVTDETYCSAIGANARRLAETMFSVGAVVDDIESLYARLISA